MPLEGTANGQDGLRRAAMQYMAPGGGPGPVQAQMGGAGAPQSGVADLLDKAFRMTMASPDKQTRDLNLGYWKQALLMFKGQLDAVQGGPQQGVTPPPPGGSMMGQMGAQAMSPTVGRPPR